MEAFIKTITLGELKERIKELEEVDLLNDKDIWVVGVVDTQHPGEDNDGYAYDL